MVNKKLLCCLVVGAVLLFAMFGPTNSPTTIDDDEEETDDVLYTKTIYGNGEVLDGSDILMLTYFVEVGMNYKLSWNMDNIFLDINDASECIQLKETGDKYWLFTVLNIPDVDVRAWFDVYSNVTIASVEKVTFELTEAV